MPIAHRVRTGLFYPVVGAILERKLIDKADSGRSGQHEQRLKNKLGSELYSWFACSILAVLYCLFVVVLLQSNDIEKNPGPSPNVELSEGTQICLESRFAQILTTIHMQGVGLSRQMFDHFNSLSAALKNIQDELCRVKRYIRHNKEDISELQQYSLRVNDRLDKLEAKMERMDTTQREKNVVFFGEYEPRALGRLQ